MARISNWENWVPKRTEAEIRASLERIEAVLREHPQGLQRTEIQEVLEAKYNEPTANRTLRRRLRQLVQEERIVSTGRGPAVRYQAIGRDTRTPPLTGEDSRRGEEDDEHPEGRNESDISLSPQGLELQRQVRLPRHQRKPCTYDRDFLEEYVPGRTWYLPENLRDQLMTTGQTPNPERPAGTYARDILDRLLIDLSWASSRLEGNTYSRLDTQNLLEYGIHAEGKSRREAQMILNHRAAIRMLVDNVEDVEFDRRTLLGLHAALAENLVADPGDEGALRLRPVDIGDTVYTPSGIPQLIQECLDLLLEKVRGIPDPFEQAFFVMVHIPYLQPFIDVNKRTSRIAANIPFLKGNLCPLSFVDVPHETYIEATIAIYEQRNVALLRDLFMWAYKRSADRYRIVRESLGEPDAVRFRYRDQLGNLVKHTVRNRLPPQRGQLQAWARDHGIEEEDQDVFVDRAMEILLNLTEGVARRHGLTGQDVEAWRTSLPVDRRASSADYRG